MYDPFALTRNRLSENVQSNRGDT